MFGMDRLFNSIGCWFGETWLYWGKNRCKLGLDRRSGLNSGCGLRHKGLFRCKNFRIVGLIRQCFFWTFFSSVGFLLFVVGLRMRSPRKEAKPVTKSIHCKMESFSPPRKCPFKHLHALAPEAAFGVRPMAFPAKNALSTAMPKIAQPPIIHFLRSRPDKA